MVNLSPRVGAEDWLTTDGGRSDGRSNSKTLDRQGDRLLRRALKVGGVGLSCDLGRRDRLQGQLSHPAAGLLRRRGLGSGRRLGWHVRVRTPDVGGTNADDDQGDRETIQGVRNRERLRRPSVQAGAPSLLDRF
jgi:hypothetical protein